MAEETPNLFEIVEADVRGVRMRVFQNAPPSLRAIWDMSALHGASPYLVYGDERWTFGQAHEQVAALAARLAGEHGVRQGDRVAIALRNYPEWALAFWAAISLGAVVVPLNAWWTGPELAYGLADSGSRVLFADQERAERMAPLLADTPVERVILVRASAELPGSEPFEQAVAGAGRAQKLPEVSIEPDDDATIMYTSGTTGRPKGAVHTHRNFAAHLMNMMYRQLTAAASAPQPPAAVAGPPATLLTFPLFHVGGLQSFLLPFTATGGKIVLMYKWDAREAVGLVEREGVTTVAGVPTTVFQLLEEASSQGRSLASLGGVASGATLVPPELVRRIDAQLESRAAPTNGYGLTETSGAAVANAGPEYLARPDSVGKPISPVMEVRVVGPDGKELPAGAVGEIIIRGPTVVRGYFGLEKETAESFRDGWFHTGDLGRFDDEGYLYVVDRLKDMIIRGGENIYAAEVEAALYEHPDITEAAIIGLPHERLGEEVGAVVRTRTGSLLGAEDVKKHVAERLAAFKVPSQVWIVDQELPRNAAGKVLKRELRESLTGGA